MSALRRSGTERLSRALIRLLPRTTREDFGEPMVQLASDRRRFGGEPIWRLWPSLVVDALSTSARTHWEQTMPRVPAAVIGFIFAIAAFAILSASPLVGLPVAAVGAAVLWSQRGRTPAHADGSRRWVPLALAGVALVALSLGVIAVQDDEFSEPAWLTIMVTLLAGLPALGTAAVVALHPATDPRRTAGGARG